MKYIFFPGNSISNKEWINSFSLEFNNQDKTVLSYNHWDTGEKQINFNKELEKIRLLDFQEDCVAICKSAGCYLSYLASKNKFLNINKFVFIGYPYFWLENLKLNPMEALNYSNDRVLIIQKEMDLVIGYYDISRILDENNIKVEIIKYEREGEAVDTHHYEDTKYLKEMIEEYLNR
jgi:hypothetical protein